MDYATAEPTIQWIVGKRYVGLWRHKRSVVSMIFSLVREVPEEESRSLMASSSQSLTAEGRWGLIRDVCQKHRGEVLEINGSWRYLYTPFLSCAALPDV